MLLSKTDSTIVVNQKVNLPPNAFPLAEPLVEQLNTLGNSQLIWLSGYCAGLAGFSAKDNSAKDSGGGASAVQPSVASALPGQSTIAATTLIAFASQTGNAEKVARQLSSKLKQAGIDVEAKNLLKVKPKSLKDYQQIIILASTHGEGEPPDNAIAFHQFLASKRAPDLTGSYYAVLGLGDSSYEHFCQTAKDFDERLQALGAKALVARQDCDVDFESDAGQWIEQVTERLLALDSTQVSSATDNASGQSFDAVTSTPTFNKSNPFAAEILVNQLITGEGSTKNIHHIEIDISGSGINYSAGDGLGIIPCNSDAAVEKIIAALQLDGEQVLSWQQQSMSLQQWLTEKLEISQLNKTSLIWLRDHVTDSSKLDALIEDFSSYKNNHQWLDVIETLQPKIESAEIFQLFKPLKPRIYSISSSPKVDEEEVHITVALSETENESRRLHGCASDYLVNALKAGDSVKVFVEPNPNFRFPEDDTPVIMIGPGTGIAPFRAFLQEREESGATGDNWLLFGNPHFNTDFLYQLEIQEFISNGLLGDIDLAFSRDQQEKIYVQHRLLEKKQQLWQWLDEKKAVLYVCGDANRMAKDVESALLSIIQDEGKMDASSARDYLNELRIQNRYQRDVY